MGPTSADRDLSGRREQGAAGDGSPVVSAASAEALEFPSFLALLASLAATDAGAETISSLQASADRGRLEARREAYEEASRLLQEGALVPSIEESLRSRLEALAADSPSFGGEDLLVLASLIRASGEAAQRIAAAETPCRRLAAAAEKLADLESLGKKIASTLDGRGAVRDDASPALKRLAASARRVRDGLYRDLRRYSERRRDELSEDTVPLYAGRLVVKLRAGSHRAGGLVHGRSATGKSLYFEPLEVVEGNNRLQETLERVEEEKRRLLQELLRETARRLPELWAHLGFLAELDLLQSAFRFAERCEGRPAELSTTSLELVEARHPLLDARLVPLRRQALGQAGHTGEIVPLDLRLDAERRILVVTGPNAGGKTVALKTVGLLAVIHQCGLPLPAARGSRLPIFETIVATIGDEQDLLEDRSTFSGRLLRLREAWEAARPGGLVLLDELGSGTDPEEGTALAVALVEALIERRCLGMVTTHLGRLAAAAMERDGAFCGAMEFDADSGMPTYRLTPGAPGSSEALSLARRLGLPSEWLDRAQSLLGPEHRSLQRLLAEVERVRGELAREVERARRSAVGVERRERELERRLEKLEEERRSLAPRLERELERFRREVAAQQRDEVERLRRDLAAGRRKGVASESVRRLFEEAPTIELEEAEERPIQPGDRVVHRGLGWEGQVERIEGQQAEVGIGGKRLRCAVSELRLAAAAPAARQPPRATVRLETGGEEVSAELNLIGRRVEAALEALDAYLDGALRAGHARVRIVHGHGSGRLRSAVREYLRGHAAVASARPGRDGEGGDGATVAEIRG